MDDGNDGSRIWESEEVFCHIEEMRKCMQQTGWKQTGWKQVMNNKINNNK
jgi:hypothetical protein